jgi:hypothetical protein
LLLGIKGYGKTTVVATARKPIWICSFDPGGTLTIRDEMKAGGIFADTRYEKENLRSPTAFNMWEKDFVEMEKNGFFNQLGTYVIDGGYLWMESLLAKQRLSFHGPIVNDVLTSDQLKGKDLRNLFGYFLEANLHWTRRLLNIPCNVIFTCHIDKYTDPLTGETETSLLCPGQKSVERVPIPFPEVWVLRKERDTGKRYLLTGEEGSWRGSTRIGNKGKLALHEPADVCAILKKCGYPTDPRRNDEPSSVSTTEA